MRVYAVIPALNERDSIAWLIGGISPEVCDGVVVADGGSHDGTQEAARAAGATVVVERRRGYGRAVAAGIAAARAAGADAVAVVDGNGSISPACVADVVAPLREGTADLAVGVRRPGAGQLRAHQRLGNRLAVEVIARTLGVRYGDVASVRAIRTDALDRLAVDDAGYGWPLQLLARAAAAGLRIAQIDVSLLPRQSRSKVSGTVRGSLGASTAFARVLLAECVLAPLRGGR